MKSPSGKFVLRLPPPLHRRLKEISLRRGISLNELCQSQLSQMSPAVATSPSPENEIVRRLKGSGIDSLGVVLFGSAARGEATSRSDRDLLIVLPPKAEIGRALYSLWDTAVGRGLDSNGGEISPQFVRLPQTPLQAGGLWFEVAVEGIVLWEQDFLVSRFLGQIRRAIAEGKLRRKHAHGHPYWIRDGKEGLR